MKRGLFITFEGMDGVGKSTQIKLLADYLISSGHDVLLTREPGGCPIAEKIREVILDPGNSEMEPVCEALLYAAARAQHTRQVIIPAISAGRTVICDRFYDSSVAYQGYARRLGADTVAQINYAALNGLKPDITLLLSLPPDMSFRRKHDRKDDRMEIDNGPEFFSEVYDGFMRCAEAEPGRIVVIDASGEKERTQEKIRAAVEKAL